MGADDDLASLDLEWGSDDQAPSTVEGGGLAPSEPSTQVDELPLDVEEPSRATMPFALDARAIFANFEDEAPRGDRPTAPPPVPAVVYEEDARLRTRDRDAITAAPPRPRAPMPTVREDLSELARLVELGGTPTRPPPRPHAAPEVATPHAPGLDSHEVDPRESGADRSLGSLSDLDFSELAVPSRPAPPSATLLDPGELGGSDEAGDPVVIAVQAFDEAEAELGESPAPEARAHVQRLREGAERALLSRIGDIGVPVVLCGRLGGPETADMDHRSGFVASLLDGTMTTAELLEVSPLRPVDTLRVVAALMERGLARLEP
jgi:hypothetical protein